MKKFLPLLLALAFVGAGCGAAAPSNEQQPSGDQNQQQNQQPAASANTVTIQDFAFAPAVLTVKKGTTVTFINKDAVQHSAVADSGKWQSDLLKQNQTYTRVFDTVGKFTYHCGPHNYMKGTIEVTE